MHFARRRRAQDRGEFGVNINKSLIQDRAGCRVHILLYLVNKPLVHAHVVFELRLNNLQSHTQAREILFCPIWRLILYPGQSLLVCQ